MRSAHFSVTLIHNQNPFRLSHVRPAAQSLARLWNTDLTEVFEQPNPVPLHSRARTLWRAHCHVHADQRWRRHRGGAVSSRVRLIGDHLALITYVFTFADQARQSSAIGAILTEKHIEAWRHAQSRAADFLLVLEDDATFKPDSMARFVALSCRLEAFDPQLCLYVDVAGGLPLNDLGLASIERESRGDVIAFAKPVTNTSCAYLISKGAIDAFLEASQRRRWARRGLSADWFINMLMVETFKTRPLVCWHASPTILVHGTKTGLYRSALERHGE